LSIPKIIDSNTLEYTVPSSLNKVEMEREFVYFLPFIRKALNNFSIVINVIVKETGEKKFIYTPEEKYQRLIEINPLLGKLRKELDLDL
jgi:DNA polymerase-3 subunit gamma/tau